MHSKDIHADITMLQHKLFPVERQDDHPNAVDPAVNITYQVNNTLNIEQFNIHKS